MPVGELAAVSNAALWALVGTIAKSMPSSVRPLHVTSSHAWTTVVILVVILVALGNLTDLTTMDRDTFLLFVGSGLVNSAGSITFWVAISRSQISKVFPTTQGLFILVTLISSTIFFDTSLGIGLVGGAILVLSGVILMNWKRDDVSESSQDLRGTLILIGMMLATAIFWVVGLLTTVEGLKNTEPIIATIIRNGIPAIIYLVIAIVYPRMGYKKAVGASPAKMLAGGLVFTLAAWMFVFAVDNTSPSVVAVLTNTSPLWAVLLGRIFLKEKMGPRAGMGMILCVVGIIIVVLIK